MPIYPNSRYRYNLIYEDTEGRQYLDEREPFRYRDDPDNRFHTVVDGDTWWGLAGIYFAGMPRACGLYWLLCEYQPQPVIDATIALKIGATIVIPPMRLVRMEVFNPEQRRFH
jgi:hypothetical protein